MPRSRAGEGGPATPWVPGVRAQVSVPGSSANLGPAFDSVGLALDVRDEYGAEVTDGRELQIVLEGEGAGSLPTDESHLVHRAMRRAWQELGVPAPQGLRLTCRNTIPLGAGLGSSAAAVVAGAALAHALHSAPGAAAGDAEVDLDLVIALASDMEGHPDNASASVHGGMTLSWDQAAAGPGASRDTGSAGGRRGVYAGVRTERLTLHPDLQAVVLVPDAQTLSTTYARGVLPEQVPMLDALRNSARVGLLVHAVTARPDLLRAGTRDWLHQEYRRESYPEAMGLVDTLRDAGHAAVISGAGPSVLVLGTGASAEGLEDLVPRGWQLLRPGAAADGLRVTIPPPP